MSLPPSSASSLVSISTGVENDLRTLIADGKKKVNDLQPSAERAIAKLKQIQQQAPSTSPPSTPKSPTPSAPESFAETLQSDLILRPLLLVTSAKTPKLTITALGAVQKLLGLNPLTSRFIATVIGTLRIQAEDTDGSVQLKILQTLLLCIAPASIACGEILTGSLLQSLGVTFKLYGNKSPMVSNTSSAALRQIITLLFDRIEADSKAQSTAIQQGKAQQLQADAGKGNEEMKSSNTSVVVSADDVGGPLEAMTAEQVNGFLLFRDLCILSNASDIGKTSPRWLNLSSTVSPALCVELLEGVIGGNRGVFLLEPAFFMLLKRDVCVLLSRLLRSNFDFPIVVRVVRCVTLLVKHFHSTLPGEVEVFLTLLIKMLGQEFPMWQHILVLEALTQFTASSPLLYFFYSRYDDRGNKVIGSVCHTLGGFISSSQVGGDTNGLLGYKVSGGKKPIKALELLNEEEAPVYDEVYRVSLSIESIIQIIKMTGDLATLADAPTNPDSPPDPTSEDVRPDREVLKRLVLACWTPILASLSFLLAKTNEEVQVQHLLMAYQTFTNTCGLLQLVKPRDALLSSLCSFALKKQLPRDDPISELMKEVLTPGPDGSLQSLLTAKNIQALKALFNIAHCLGSYLGQAWTIVLETFHSLDTVIQLSQEVQTRMMRDTAAMQEQYKQILPNAAEIVIMNTALSRLFESTRYLDDAAVTQVLSALGALSLTTLAAAGDTPPSLATSPGSTSRDPPPTMRVFSLANLIATIEHNMFRISSAKLWELGINHLTCVITHRDPRIRAYGVEALRKLTILALGKRPTGPAGGKGSGPVTRDEADEKKGGEGAVVGGGGGPGGLKVNIYDDPEVFQIRLLSPLTELYVKSKYDDTRLQLLQTLHSILQAAGQSMSAGWTTILDWLGLVCEIGGTPGSPRETKPGEKDKTGAVSGVALISLGFNSIQLIVNDFIDGIPLDRMPRLIATIGQYSLQRLDTNISFTSIGLLWRVSDYIARVVGVHIPRRRASVSEPAPQHGGRPDASANGDDVLTETAADQLMLALFTQLHSLSVDLRSEVRNSAVKTFSSTLVAHGARMRADSCIECLQSFQLPLLADLMSANTDRERESQGATSTELGKNKDTGASVMMMVHHSRDTAAKQWDETRVFALQGAARVMKVYIESWSALQQFVDLWPRYLAVVQTAIAHRSTEVSLAAVNALQEVLAAPSSHASIQEQPALWTPVIPMYKATVDYAVLQANQLINPPGATPPPVLSSLSTLTAEAGWKHWLKVYTQLVQTWQVLLSSPTTRTLFSDADMSSVLDLASALTEVEVPVVRRKGVIDNETSLQAAVLRLLETLTPIPSHQWPLMISHLLSYILPATADQGGVSPFTRKALKVLDGLYAGGPTDMRARQFGKIIEGLSSLLQHCHTWPLSTEGEGCEEVVQSFVHIVEAGLPAATEVGVASPQVWQSLLTALSAFLTTPHAPPLPPLFLPSLPTLLPPHASDTPLWEHLQIAMVGLLVRHVLPSSLSCPLEVQWQLILLLNVGYDSTHAPVSATQPVASELLSHACMMGLFALVSLSAQTEGMNTCYLRVGLLCLPLLIHRCQGILTAYVGDQGKRAGGALPQCRREEMGFVLRELHSLTTPPQVSAVLKAESQLDYVKGLKVLEGVGEEGGVGWRGHLLVMFPALCDCVCVGEQDLRELLSGVLHAVSTELGLERGRRVGRKVSAAQHEAQNIANHSR